MDTLFSNFNSAPLLSYAISSFAAYCHFSGQRVIGYISTVRMCSYMWTNFPLSESWLLKLSEYRKKNAHRTFTSKVFLTKTGHSTVIHLRPGSKVTMQVPHILLSFKNPPGSASISATPRFRGQCAYSNGTWVLKHKIFFSSSFLQGFSNRPFRYSAGSGARTLMDRPHKNFETRAQAQLFGILSLVRTASQNEPCCQKITIQSEKWGAQN